MHSPLESLGNIEPLVLFKERDSKLLNKLLEHRTVNFIKLRHLYQLLLIVMVNCLIL